MRVFLSRIVGFFRRDARPRHLVAGEWGEKLAAQFLSRKSYQLLGSRVRIGLRDELDLVARSPEGVLVFVEVKTRRSEEFGRPFSAVNARKRKALSRAAWSYLKRVRPKPAYFRFDVIEVIGEPGGAAPEIRHIENAFSLLGKKRIGW